MVPVALTPCVLIPNLRQRTLTQRDVMWVLEEDVKWLESEKQDVA